MTHSMLNALEVGDKLELNMALKSYKLQNGAVNYQAVLSIPREERIPALLQLQGYKKVHKVILAGIQLAMESMNLSNSLTATQVFDLSDMLIDSSSEDNLAVQDVVLFLQKLTRGEMGKLYNQMDVPKFMELFEVYREERFQELVKIREEQDAQYKSTGDPTRWTDTQNKEEERSMGNAMKEYMQMKYNKPQE